LQRGVEVVGCTAWSISLTADRAPHEFAKASLSARVAIFAD
jgi:hypothetical protein